MARFIGYEPCPKCVGNGRDRSGDNLGCYSDGSAHCFSCGWHRYPRRVLQEKEKVDNGAKDKDILPRDFTREVPAAGWKWLLQYGLSYSYWKPLTGYSPAEERLILTFGNPIKFSIGRYIGNDTGERGENGKWIRRPPRKWYFYGDGHGFVEVLGEQNPSKTEVTVLVEDLISAHKVAQVAPTISLFGTNITDKVLQVLKPLKRPTVLWLDEDQYALLPKKINRLQAFLDHPVRFIRSEKDPKEYGIDEIRTIIAGV